ncbi:MAG: hypothetical protein KC417_12960, partial [Myxococcales bacterium]|nr:hypothetical protein [Myxococcales bacterium]
EFQLKDESKIIQGVGRVVWTRDVGADTDAEHPPGMGIKFIKMDPESSALVESIVGARGDGEGEYESKPSESPPAASFFPSDSPPADGPGDDDRTQVREANEFLASALEGTDPAAAEEAKAAARAASSDRPLSGDDDDTGKVSTHPKERRSSRPAEAKSPSGAPSSKKGTSERPAAKEPAAEPAPAQGKPFPAGILLALVAVVAVVIYFVAFRSGGGRDEAAGAELPSMGSPTGSAAPEPEAPAPEPATALDDAGSPEEASVDAGAATTASPTTPEETKPAPRVVRVTTTPTGALVKYRMTTETSPATLEIRPIDKSAVLFITLPGHRAVRHVVKPTDFADVDGAPVAEVSVELVPFVAKPAKPAAPKPATGGTAAEQSSMPPPANLVGGGTESAPAPKEAAPKEPAPSSDPTPAPAPKAPESAPPAESPATP